MRDKYLTRTLCTLALLTAAALWALLLSRCGASQVHTESLLAAATADVFNRAEPLWVSASERDCNARTDRMTTRDTALAELARCRADWGRVAVAWESARAAHTVVRSQLNSCQYAMLDGGPTSCGPDADRALADFLRVASVWRCAVRTLGHAELDILPGSASCATLDGGTSQ